MICLYMHWLVLLAEFDTSVATFYEKDEKKKGGNEVLVYLSVFWVQTMKLYCISQKQLY